MRQGGPGMSKSAAYPALRVLWRPSQRDAEDNADALALVNSIGAPFSPSDASSPASSGPLCAILEEGWRDQYADRASDMSEKMAPSLASAGAGVFLLVD